MAHEKHIVDRISTRLPSLLPEWIKDEAPIFESFLQAYFEFLESEIIVLESLNELEGIRLEDGTSEEASQLLLEDGTSPASPQEKSRVIIDDNIAIIGGVEKELNNFQVGEYVFGQTNGSLAQIKVINGKTLYVDSISGTGFAVGESIIGRDGNQTGVIQSYKENQVVANNRLLDYSDIDKTLETFLQYFQKDFIPSLDLKDTQNPRLTLKNIGSLYKQKGTTDSVKFLMRLLYGQDAEVKYPIDETLVISESQFNEDRRITVQMTNVIKKPIQNDKVVQYDVNDSTLITAEAIVESAYVLDSNSAIYNVSISYTHRGTFDFNRPVTFVDRDGVSRDEATVLGIISTIDNTNSSLYFELEDNAGDLLLETGGGLLMERTSLGSMYEFQDVINFSGSKTDTDAVSATSNVTGLSRGGVERVYIENGGQNYSAGDLVIFNDSATGGNGAEGIIGVVGDELLLENALATDQYEFTATANQTVFGGLGVVDKFGKPIALPPSGDVDVLIDGVLQAETTYSFALDKITFTTNPNLSGGETVEIVAQTNNLVFEDATPDVGGEVIFLDGSTQEIRSIEITNPGAGYEKLPTVFPGGYLYFSDTTGFQAGDIVTGATSSATGQILRIESSKNRLVIIKNSTHVNNFQSGENITSTSNSTGTICTTAKVSGGQGAKLFAWSPDIGAVEKLTITSQGYNFDNDAILSNTSFHNMLITGPTSSLDKGVVITGVGSGATAQVQSYDSQRQILKYTNLSGQFLDNEKVTYAVSDSFKILKNDNFTAIGKVAGEGLINDSFLSDQGFVSEKNSHIQDSFYYQTHSYVVKVGESVNKYRSVLKDIIHPSGHIFFGEVAIKSEILGTEQLDETINTLPIPPRFEVNPENRMGIVDTTFLPTIVIQAFPTNNVLLEDKSADFTDGSTRDVPVRVLLEDNSLLESEESRDNIAQTSRERVLLLLTTKDEVDAGLHLETQIRHALSGDTVLELEDDTGDLLLEDGGKILTELSVKNANLGTDALGNVIDVRDDVHFNVLTVRKFLSSTTQSLISSRVADGVHATFPTTATFNSVVQKSPRRDGVLSVSNMVDKENDYYVPDLGVSFDASNPQGVRGSVEVRPADSGRVFQLYNPSEEILVFEGSTTDAEGNQIGGGRILNEEPLNYLRQDPFDRDLHGHKILLEDDSGTILLEDDTVPEDRDYFVTERSIELSNPFMYYEDNDRVIMENGDALLKEDAGESVHTFVPIGPTFRTLNKIAFQNCYKISYYLLDETSDTNDEDRILMEDGISSILSEESKEEGISISQLDSLLGNTYINDLDDLSRRRTNIAFSSYVNSSNVTNSTLQSL